MNAKFLPTVVKTGLFNCARKSRILLTEKLSVLLLMLSGLWFLARCQEPGPLRAGLITSELYHYAKSPVHT